MCRIVFASPGYRLGRCPLADRVAEGPAVAGPLPQVRRTKTLAQLEEVLFGHVEVTHDLGSMALGVLAVEATDERDAFFPRDVMVPDLLRRVVARPAETEFDPRRVVMESIDAV